MLKQSETEWALKVNCSRLELIDPSELASQSSDEHDWCILHLDIEDADIQKSKKLKEILDTIKAYKLELCDEYSSNLDDSIQFGYPCKDSPEDEKYLGQLQMAFGKISPSWDIDI